MGQVNNQVKLSVDSRNINSFPAITCSFMNYGFDKILELLCLLKLPFNYNGYIIIPFLLGDNCYVRCRPF
jgi:hypothetical protein